MRQAAAQKHDEKMQAERHKNDLERGKEQTRQEKSVLDHAGMINDVKTAKKRVYDGRMRQADELSSFVQPLIDDGLATNPMIQSYYETTRSLRLDPIRMEHVVDKDALIAAIEAANSPEGLSRKAPLDRLIAGFYRPVNDVMAQDSVAKLLLAVGERTRDTAGHKLLQTRVNEWIATTKKEIGNYTNNVVTPLFQVAGYQGNIDFNNPMAMYTEIEKGWKIPHNGVKGWADHRQKDRGLFGDSPDPKKNPTLDIFSAMTPQGFPGENLIRGILESGGDVTVTGGGPEGQEPKRQSDYGMRRGEGGNPMHKVPPEVAYVSAYALSAYSELIALEARGVTDDVIRQEMFKASKSLADLGGLFSTSHRGIGVPPQKAAIEGMFDEIQNMVFGGSPYKDIKPMEAEMYRAVEDFQREAGETMTVTEAISRFARLGVFSSAAMAYDHPLFGTAGDPSAYPPSLGVEDYGGKNPGIRDIWKTIVDFREESDWPEAPSGGQQAGSSGSPGPMEGYLGGF